MTRTWAWLWTFCCYNKITRPGFAICYEVLTVARDQHAKGLSFVWDSLLCKSMTIAFLWIGCCKRLTWQGFGLCLGVLALQEHDEGLSFALNYWLLQKTNVTRVWGLLGAPCFARRNKDCEALDLFLSFADVTRILFQTSEVFFSSNAAGAGGGARGGGVAPLVARVQAENIQTWMPKTENSAPKPGSRPGGWISSF